MADSIDRLEIQVQAQAQKANSELEKMASRLERVSSVLSRITEYGGVERLSSGIDKLSVSMQNMSNVKTADFTRLAKNIEKLGNINQAGINNTASALRQISSALTASTVSGEVLKGLSDLANAISRLGYKSVTNAITNLPLLAQSMRQFMATISNAPKVSQNLIQMTNAMANLAAQGSKYGSTIKSISNATNTLTRSQNTAYKSNINFLASLSKLTVGFYILRRAVRSAFGPLDKAMNYGETINLFQTSFKKIGMESAQEAGMAWGSESANAYAMSFINEAQAFNDRITEALSLDPNTIMNYQAVFAQMANAFNLTNRSVMNLSKSFTMLGLDISSFFNTGVEEAMVKLRAGLAGETEPLRTLGIDITEATLKMVAMRYGIKGTVSEMSQATKTQLRWLAIMEQADTVFGDMAKTIQSPANQMRILQQQWDNFSRTLGQIFIPIATTVLPYINAFVIVLQRMASIIAGAMGYELPDYTGSDIYTDITGDIIGIGDAADDSTKSVNKLKKALASFDQLNILSEGKSKGINIGSGASGVPILDDAIAKKTESYMEKFNEELGNMKNKAEELAAKIEPKIKDFVQFIKDLSPLLAGAAASLGALAIINFFTELGNKIATLANTPGLPVALAIGGIAAIYLAIKEYNEKLVQEDLEGRFGKIVLSMKEIEEIADRLTTSEYTANIDIYVTEKQKLSEIEKDIQTDIETLNKLNWKVSVGIGLTEGEVEQYRATIESFIVNTQAYIEQQQYVVNLAIDAVIQSDDEFNQEISNLVDEYFNGSKAEMVRLGTQLRQEMDKALADGVLDAKEKEVIGNLIDEINQITSAVADAEFKATLQMITVDGELSADSFKDLTEKVQEKIDKRLKSEEEAYFTALTYVNIAYEAKLDEAKSNQEKAELKKQWDEDVAKLAEEFSQTKATITLEGMSFSLDVLNQNYSDAMEKVRPGLNQSTKDVLSEDIIQNIAELGSKPEYAPYAMGEFATALYDAYGEALSKSGLSNASKEGLRQMLEALEPTTEQYQKIYDDALAAGTKIPDGVSDALTNIMTLKALTGDMDAIYYLIGQKLSTDQTFLDLLKTGNVAGSSLNKSMIDGMKSMIPDLELQAGKLVTKSGKAVSTTLTEDKDTIKGYGERFIKYFKNAFDNDGTAALSVKGWLDKISKEIQNYKLPTLSLSTQLLLNTSGVDPTDPLGIIKPEYKIQGRASGGFVNTGEAFIARENGIPEMVGRIGNRTAVANNDQITEGISSAVKGALIEVLVPALSSIRSSGSQTIEVPLYIDGEELARGIYNGRQSYEGRMNPVRVGG